MQLTIDRAWILEIIQQRLHDAPDVTDWGSIGAAVARHSDTIMDEPVYTAPHHRAAALFQSLLRIPALEHSNEIFALSVAFGFLQLCGMTAKVSTDVAGDLVDQTLAGTADVRQIAATLKSWT
ncbi:fic family toxin-antitoxin system, toxin component [Streptomyces sp. NPDC051662]|uniref:fic family toxin-antitoxin system, toxin component n=1 Tax=Streptomyces sp. NPDC051662 TaxID=3154750 RepID=UPI0034212345